MRERSLSPLMAAVLLAGMGAAMRPRPGIREAYPEDFDELDKRVVVDADREPSKRGYDREPPKPRPAPPPRVLTEADNTRLRRAAEKRWRKAQRQAKGMKTDG